MASVSSPESTQFNQPFTDTRTLRLQPAPEFPVQTRFFPCLAAEIGMVESIVLLQIDFILGRRGITIKGEPWVRLTPQMLHQDLCNFSLNQLYDGLKKLLKRNLLKSANYNQHPHDRTRWFALNVSQLNQLRSIVASAAGIQPNLYYPSPAPTTEPLLPASLPAAQTMPLYESVTADSDVTKLSHSSAAADVPPVIEKAAVPSAVPAADVSPLIQKAAASVAVPAADVSPLIQKADVPVAVPAADVSPLIQKAAASDQQPHITITQTNPQSITLHIPGLPEMQVPLGPHAILPIPKSNLANAKMQVGASPNATYPPPKSSLGKKDSKEKKKNTKTQTQEGGTPSGNTSRKRYAPAPPTLEDDPAIETPAGFADFYHKLAEVCAIQPGLVRKRDEELLASTRALWQYGGFRAEDLEGYEAWWRAADWRGRKGDIPRPPEVAETLTAYRSYRQGRVKMNLPSTNRFYHLEEDYSDIIQS